MLFPRKDLSDLLHQGLELGRFAGRWSEHWLRGDDMQPWPIGLEARAQIPAGEAQAEENVQQAIEELRLSVYELAGAADAPEAVYQALSAAHDARSKAAAAAAEAAPAAAVAIYDDVVQKWGVSKDWDGSPLTVGGRRFVSALEVLVGPVLRPVEQRVADAWLAQRTPHLRTLVDRFEAAVAPHLDALAGQSPDGGRRLGAWCRPSWAELLLALARALLDAAPQGRSDQLLSIIEALADQDLLTNLLVELAHAPAGSEGASDAEAATDAPIRAGWGPHLTFWAVCDQILSEKAEPGAQRRIEAGDTTLRAAVLDRVADGDQDKLPVTKARQYLALSSRLVKQGLLTRQGERLSITAAGADYWCSFAT